MFFFLGRKNIDLWHPPLYGYENASARTGSCRMEESDFNLVTMLDIDESPIHFMSSDRSVFIVWRYKNNR
ncbi:hypothetical protein RHMOL_Rhmol08G0150100 [Rhododendron molle]|uniref:Uncharacterized protein n=1 Tax=Rhododendron molle TaxID=49168 RepID=A0ACC0MNH0_RHOML|nr:hypothetical protein RHMOL_Rhmol08G0150100 [Rhododendron molle]